MGVLARDAEWEVDTGRLLWLEQQLHENDKNQNFPVTFTERMNWEEVVAAGHDYTWRHIVKGSPTTAAKL